MSGPERRIVAAALECFGRRGIARTTMEDVARVAGLSRATLYRYYPNRDAVLAATIRSEAARLLGTLGSAAARGGDVGEALSRVLHTLQGEFAAHDVLRRVLETEPELLLPRLSTESRAVVAMLGAFVGPMLEGATAAGELPATDAAMTAEFVGRMLLSFALNGIGPLGPRDLDECRDVVAFEVLGGLQAGPPRPPGGRPSA